MQDAKAKPGAAKAKDINQKLGQRDLRVEVEVIERFKGHIHGESNAIFV